MVDVLGNVQSVGLNEVQIGLQFLLEQVKENTSKLGCRTSPSYLVCIFSGDRLSAHEGTWGGAQDLLMHRYTEWLTSFLFASSIVQFHILWQMRAPTGIWNGIY